MFDIQYLPVIFLVVLLSLSSVVALVFTLLLLRSMGKIRFPSVFRLTIGRRISIGFLVVSLAPLFIVSLMSYFSARDIIVRQSIQQLENIRDLKADKIETYFDDIEGDLVAARDFLNVKKNLPVLIENIDRRESLAYINAKSELDSQLETFVEAENLLEFLLFDTEGKLMYSTDFVHSDADLNKKFVEEQHVEVMEGLEGVYFGEIFLSEFSESGFEMLVVGPAINREGELIGIIGFAIDMGPVYELIQDDTGLGDTGETLIGKLVIPKEGSEDENSAPYVVFINTLRHDQDAALNRTVVVGSEVAIPIQEATAGRSGSGISVDYRGKEIVAAWEHLPMQNWGLVAKIDADERLAPVLVLGTQYLVVLLVAVGGILIISSIISRSISSRVEALSNTVEKIRGGDLDVNINVHGRDEVSELASNFSKMAAELKSSRGELEEKLEQLEKFHKLTVDRELKMAELKKEIKLLKESKS